MLFRSGIGGERTGVRYEETSRRTTSTFRTGRQAIVNKLVKSKRPVVVDDFHVVPEDVRAMIIFGLKAVIDQGTTVVVISIPEVTEEINRSGIGTGETIGRRAVVSGPPWTAEEIGQIPKRGFRSLNVSIDYDTINTMVRYSYRNPLLMQHYCARLCFELGIEATLERRQSFVVEPPVIQRVIGQTAAQYDSVFAHAIQSTEANDGRWQLKDRRLVNIYLLIMLAVAKIAIEIPVKPVTIRKRIADILAEGVEPPNEAAIHNALTQLAKRIDDGKADPVFRYDADKKYAYVAHPFFKVFLQWSLAPKYAAVFPKAKAAADT